MCLYQMDDGPVIGVYHPFFYPWHIWMKETMELEKHPNYGVRVLYCVISGLCEKNYLLLSGKRYEGYRKDENVRSGEKSINL